MKNQKNTDLHLRPTQTPLDFRLGRYECVENGHNKFWECLHFESSSQGLYHHKFLIRWGRIGAKKPQSMIVIGYHQADVKIREKERKGYKKINNSPVTAQMSDQLALNKTLNELMSSKDVSASQSPLVEMSKNVSKKRKM